MEFSVTSLTRHPPPLLDKYSGKFCKIFLLYYCLKKWSSIEIKYFFSIVDFDIADLPPN